jgi:plasmid stabilization system protein ParE
VVDYSLRIHPDAEDDAQSAHAWYVERSSAAAAQFLTNLDIAIGRIRGSPERWPRVFGGYRRFILAKFPFSVVYRTQGNRIEVIAIAHHRRRPRYWTERD